VPISVPSAPFLLYPDPRQLPIYERVAAAGVTQRRGTNYLSLRRDDISSNQSPDVCGDQNTACDRLARYTYKNANQLQPGSGALP